ncbi:complexin-3-like [Mustelus asterias]
MAVVPAHRSSRYAERVPASPWRCAECIELDHRTGSIVHGKEPEATTHSYGKAGKLSRDDYRRHLQALEEERQRRDKEFAKRKAERAVMRSQIRAKYQLGQNDRDTQQLRAVTGKVDVPVELAAVIKVGRGSEGPSSRLGEFRGLPEVNLSELSNSAQSAISQLRESAGRQCALM